MELEIKHKASAHCENGVISTLLRHHGIEMSEPMIFGLASGIFFVHMPFVKVSGMPMTAFRTFPGVLFSRVTKLLGIKAMTKRFIDKKAAMRMLDKVLIEQKKPVGCVVGMYYLPYMPPEYRFHFNGHNICITGRSDTLDEYIVHDSNAMQKVTISSKDLIKVRFAKGGTYPLMGQMYWIDSLPETLPDIKPLIIKSIRKTCRFMVPKPNLNPFVGARGIVYLSKRIRQWETQMGKRKAVLNLAQLIRMAEEIGTGGAGFRFMYGAFLQEAAEVTGIQEFNFYSKRITDIGDKWREFAYKASRIYKKRDGENYTYDDLGDMLQEIGSEEHRFFTELNSFSKKIKLQ